MIEFIRGLPKAELHVHIEGTLEPETMFELAARNSIELPYSSADEVRAAYEFDDLQSFLDIYYEGAAVLRTAQDFDDLMWAYLRRAHADGVRHAEMFFDPQTHTERGIGFDVFMPGFAAARARALEQLGVSTHLIMCFVRHLPPSSALETWHQAGPFLDQIRAVGLDSSEVGNPPGDFAEVYRLARAAGLEAVAHAGEEGPPDYVREALDELRVSRIDHGVRSIEDPDLMARIAEEKVPLTMCPLSNVKLRVFDTLADHTLPRFLEEGVIVTINSDDPAYFGGYVGENYVATARALDLSREQLVQLAKNSFAASFISNEEQERLLGEIDRYVANEG